MEKILQWIAFRFYSNLRLPKFNLITNDKIVCINQRQFFVDEVTATSLVILRDYNNVAKL